MVTIQDIERLTKLETPTLPSFSSGMMCTSDRNRVGSYVIRGFLILKHELRARLRRVRLSAGLVTTNDINKHYIV